MKQSSNSNYQTNDQSSYDLKNPEEAELYLKNINIEYSFQCYGEKLPDGCYRLAEFLESVRQDWNKAFEIFKFNCEDNNHGKSCFKLGNYYMLGKVCSKDIGISKKFYEKSCELGCGMGCHNAGLLHHDGKHFEKNLPKALDYMERGCRLKDMPSCMRAASYLIKGMDGIPRDMEKVKRYSEIACDMDVMPACANLAIMYERGDGVEKNRQLADKYRKIYDNYFTVLKQQRITPPSN